MKDIKKILATKTKSALTSNILNADAIRNNIIILDELKHLIPPLSDEEFSQLSNNILTHGCQTPLQVWQTPKATLGLSYSDIDELAYVLIDGHNRYRICTDNHKPFELYVLSFQTMKEAKDYMIDLQLGRRNLTPQHTSYLRGLRYNNEKADKTTNLSKGQNVLSGDLASQNMVDLTKISPKGQNVLSEKLASQNEVDLTKISPKGQNVLSGDLASQNEVDLTKISPKGQNVLSGISTSERLANEYKVSPKTIQRDAEFARGLDKLTNELRQDVLQGKSKISKADIIALSKNDAVSTITSLAQLTEIITPSTVIYTKNNDLDKASEKIAALETDIREIAARKLNKKACLSLKEKVTNLLELLS